MTRTQTGALHPEDFVTALTSFILPYIAYNSRAVSGGAAGEREAISNMMAAGDMFISVMGDFAFTGKKIIRIAVLV